MAEACCWKADLDNGILAGPSNNTWETFSCLAAGDVISGYTGGLGASLLCLPEGRKEINQPEPLLLHARLSYRVRMR